MGGKGFVLLNLVLKSFGFVNVDAETPWGVMGGFR